MTFESLKKGDCEDHAIWAWRKLIELGYESELFCGWRLPEDSSFGKGRHAWVVFKRKGKLFLLESVEKNRKNIVIPMSEAKNMYLPEVSVNGEFKMFVYGGFFQRFKS